MRQERGNNMAESMVGLKRTHRCTEVSSANIGETVTVMGWVQTRRNLGALIFVDLRDRSGLLQILFECLSFELLLVYFLLLLLLVHSLFF